MFTRLLVPLDRSSLGEQALSRAAELARACNATVDIVLVHHPDQYVDFADIVGLEAKQYEAEEKYVRDIAGELASTANISTTYAVVRGDVVSSIVARAHATSADLIVMTSHGRTGLSRAWLGSVADGVIRRASIPVLMLRPTSEVASLFGAPAPFRRILVPVDGSREGFSVLDAASTLARRLGARMVLLRIVPPVPLITTDESIASVYPTLIPDDVATARLVADTQRQLAEVARSIAEREDIQVDEHVLVAGNVAQAVLDFASAANADLIAMSTHSRGASRLLIGSMADKILRGSRLPVLLHHSVAESSTASPPAFGAEQNTPLFSIA